MTVRYVVSGLVQGVGFRVFVARRAASLGLRGFVTNLDDGRVEVVADGSSDALKELEASLRAGPRSARVAEVKKTAISDEIDVPKSFDIR